MNTGTRVLDWLYREQLRIDHEWAVRDETGFDWWPHRQRQRIEVVGTRANDLGDLAYLVRVTTDVLKDLRLTERALGGLGGTVMPFASMAGLTYSEQSGELKLVSSAWINESVRDWLQNMVSMAAALQMNEAAAHAEQLPELIGGEPHYSAHPDSGERSTPDEITEVANSLPAYFGRQPSRWKAEDFEMVVQRCLQRPPCLMASAGGSGLTGEFPYELQSSLLQASAKESHSRHGNGLMIRQRFPVESDDEIDLVRQAIQLNTEDIAEGASNAYGFGSYCPHRNDIAFVTFIPNASYSPNCLPNFCTKAAARARYGSQVLAGDDWSETWDEDGNCRAQPAIMRATQMIV